MSVTPLRPTPIADMNAAIDEFNEATGGEVRHVTAGEMIDASYVRIMTGMVKAFTAKLLEVTPQRPWLGPNESYCKKCGQPVRFASVLTGKGGRPGVVGIALDATMVKGGAYDIVEEESEGEVTGRWIAVYVRSADRGRKARYRHHSCHPDDLAKVGGR